MVNFANPVRAAELVSPLHAQELTRCVLFKPQGLLGTNSEFRKKCVAACIPSQA